MALMIDAQGYYECPLVLMSAHLIGNCEMVGREDLVKIAGQFS